MPSQNNLDDAPSSTWSVPYRTFMDDVLELYDFKAKKTVAKMRQVLREFGELAQTTGELRPALVARWRKAHPDRAPSTVHSLLRSFRSACEIGIASGYLASSPVALRIAWPDVDPPAESPDKHHAIADIRDVLVYLMDRAGLSWKDHRLYAMACLVAYTGLRKMEALGMMQADVDLDRRCLRVVSRRKLKTKASAAPVGLPDELAAVLRAWMPNAKSLWLVPRMDGLGPWTGGSPGDKPLDRLKDAAEAVGVRGFTFLSLRHSWATHGEFWGLGETMIQRQLRHTTTKTQQVYRHADVANLSNSVRSISFRDAPRPQASKQA